MENLKVSLRENLVLEHPVMNAAGTCKTLEDVRKFARSAVSAIMVGSITWNPRDGNSGNVYRGVYKNGLLFYTLNSLGIPNHGKEYYEKHLKEMVAIAHDSGKPLGVSVAGVESNEQFSNFTLLALEHGADFVELNFGCPSILDAHYKKNHYGTISSSPESVDAILYDMENRVGDVDQVIFAKLSPLAGMSTFERTVHALNGSPLISGVTAINTVPDSLNFNEDGSPLLTPNSGFAGLAGPGVKPIALGNIKMLKRLLSPTLYIAGAGGATCGRDAWEILKAGADIVHIASAYFEAGENPKIYSEILAGLVEELEKRPLR